MTPLDHLHSDRIRFRMMEMLLVHRSDEIVARASLLKRFRPKHLPEIYLNQRLAEWTRFMRFLLKRKFPTRIIEIGTGRAGSTYFFASLAPLGSTIVTVDTDPTAMEFVEIFGWSERSKIICVTGDSGAEETISAVHRALADAPVDLLYIDGDHSYEGVKRDFEVYKGFCAQGSLICLHDIHPDYGVTRGTETDAKSGEVYRFWNELKAKFRCEEIIESAEQNGFGIGVLYY